ncbi:hypothetical protein K431DRAFT_221517 [Polychaeton citri CBS 116435]|uniref:SUZ domain-containing protein n=1 Tax=Polychaeton citri CBS 116435 TaxID=1314669 RepID=A0A9P4UQG4_9PEZI|nr:hypothetical protein K431DRAFT_221517 [Polychaeton citri CBS 116435]
MSAKGGVPDAWDDEWDKVVDPEAKAPPPPSQAKVSKSERRAKHAEQQKLIWDAAENPNRSFFLESQGLLPQKQQDFKPPVQLLSRKPKAPTLAKRGDGTVAGMASMNLQDDGDDSEEEARKKQEADFEERQRRAKVSREEKQQKYAEARARIMGSPNLTPSSSNSRESSQGRSERRRGGKVNSGPPKQALSAGQSPSRSPASDGKLFDPQDMGRRLPRRATPTTPTGGQPIRQPKGPDRSGRGGFGFAVRGGLAGA